MTILLCTSLRPSPRTRTFCNDLVTTSFEFGYLTRGKSGLPYLAAYSKAAGATRLWVINSRFGEPKVIECYDSTGDKPSAIASLLVRRVQLKRELKGLSPTKTGARPLRLVKPDSSSLEGLYDALSKAMDLPGTGGDADGAPRKTVDVYITPSEKQFAEIFFIDSSSKKPCGPSIYLEDFKW
ncbi:MAG TPA: hypothetical protein P5290_00750 [Candidatus Methanomethylicus sp.]|jgi:rRNA maturation protein Rpf1|nr:hypothetical protein [Candidatus Methanomethylicus sp.]HRR53855.1 hypothetical protein [Candidatus Methanomethylicus sp.]